MDVSDTSRFIAKLSPYFVDTPAECPYTLDRTAVYHQAGFSFLPPAVLEEFLAAGYRRNGNTIYGMRCPDCTACVPIRLETAAFRPSRNMRRVWQRNQDIEISVGPLEVTPEKLQLLDRFFNSRYPGRASTASDYYSGFFFNSLAPTMEISFRLSGQLLGVSIVDLAERSLSAVYFYFDPDCEKRSLGTFNILYLNELAKREHCDYLYLGYWIEEVAAMTYKARFRPHSVLRNNEWRQVD
ncbi:arginyltransferase [Thiovibrio frasassiensis]|uniref:Aspartate/glutamate leucyltransferase n=1 Tax=Thiovibrio frasassiensis TaxID=2984131 RepID=A0A9X4MJE5_9BACT|nr:arginyltransferase [Thiovibrio frasassiensis]MDG4476608.1 arginyltransferase [Thiovibrio frasassiensis]